MSFTQIPLGYFETISESQWGACSGKYLSHHPAISSRLGIVTGRGVENRSSFQRFLCSWWRAGKKPWLLWESSKTCPEWADKALNNLESLFKEQLKTTSHGGRWIWLGDSCYLSPGVDFPSFCILVEWPWQWTPKYVPFSLSRVQSGGLSTRGKEHLALLKLKEICSQQVGVGALWK